MEADSTMVGVGDSGITPTKVLIRVLTKVSMVALTKVGCQLKTADIVGDLESTSPVIVQHAKELVG